MFLLTTHVDRVIPVRSRCSPIRSHHSWETSTKPYTALVETHFLRVFQMKTLLEVVGVECRYASVKSLILCEAESSDWTLSIVHLCRIHLRVLGAPPIFL